MRMLLYLSQVKPIIHDCQFTPKNLEKEIIQRFLPGQTSKEADQHIFHRIQMSQQYHSPLTDFIYYHKKEGTIWNNINKITQIAHMPFSIMKNKTGNLETVAESNDTNESENGNISS